MLLIIFLVGNARCIECEPLVHEAAEQSVERKREVNRHQFSLYFSASVMCNPAVA